MKTLVPYTGLEATVARLHVRETRLPVIPKSAILADARGLDSLMLCADARGLDSLMLCADAGGLDCLMPYVVSETSSPVKPEPGKLMDAKDFGNAVWIPDVRGTINEGEVIDFTGEGFSLVGDTDVKSYLLRYINQPITFTEPAIHEVVLPPGEAEKIQQIFLRLEEENESELESWSAFDELEQAIKSFGIKAIEVLSKLIETTSSYTNAFITLDILGAMDHAGTYHDRLGVALTMLKHSHPSIRQGAINALASLRSRECIESLTHLIETDYSKINIKTAQRVLDLVQSPE